LIADFGIIVWDIVEISETLEEEVSFLFRKQNLGIKVNFHKLLILCHKPFFSFTSGTTIDDISQYKMTKPCYSETAKVDI